MFINKTRVYLVQQLQHYGEEFMEHIKNNRINAFAIQDYGINTSESSKKLEPYVYLLHDVNGHKKFGQYLNVHAGRYVFQQSLMFYKKHESYVTDYCYDSNKTGHLHVVVLKLPFPEKFDLFLQGKYSKMYSDTEIDRWFVKYVKRNTVEKGKKITIEETTDHYNVLKHNHEYFAKFKDQILNEFGTILTDENIDMEFDIKPKLNKEILRHDN